jgi:hypothetical protein
VFLVCTSVDKMIVEIIRCDLEIIYSSQNHCQQLILHEFCFSIWIQQSLLSWSIPAKGFFFFSSNFLM